MKLQRIVFAVDFSERCRAAAPYIQWMARRYTASISLVHAIQTQAPICFDMGGPYIDAFDVTPLAGHLEGRLRDFAREQFRHIETSCRVLKGDPASAILDFAGDTRADMIALATHGHGLFRRALLGSLTTKLLHDSSIPVWTSAHCAEPTHRAHPQPRRIIAAVDLKEETERTLGTALALARDSGAAVEVLHIAGEGHSSSTFPERVAVARAVAGAASSTALLVEEDEAADFQLETAGEPVQSVIRRIALLKRADLVVIGRGAAHNHFLSRIHSHAYSVICESPCPVLSV